MRKLVDLVWCELQKSLCDSGGTPVEILGSQDPLVTVAGAIAAC
jgi:hypothetical protein